MPLLYYWRKDNYYRDLDFGASFNLNQNNPLLHSIAIGDSLWAFTRNKNNNYVLAAELIIKAKTYNSTSFRYGKYRVWGDLVRSKYFEIENQPNFEHLIRSFSISTNSGILGRAFQGKAAVRTLSESAHQILATYSLNLKVENRAKLLPEEKLEILINSNNENSIYKLISEIPSGISEKRMQYLYQQSPQRNKKLASKLKSIYKGKCQICKWDPKNIYGKYLTESHHLRWLSRGGDDELSNLILVCPNHHRAIHVHDAVLDYSDYSLQFKNHKEKLLLNEHIF